MIRSFLGVFFILAVAILPSVASGEEPVPGRWWQQPRIYEKLQLTEAERRQLDEEFYANRTRLLQLKAQVEKERAELKRLMENDNLSEVEVLRQFRKLDTLRSDLAEERFTFLISVRKLLGLQRFEELKTLFGQSSTFKP